jgi:hypothetical protein
MTIATYLAVLHDGPTPTGAGEPFERPLDPGGTPKLVLNQHGASYRLVNQQTAFGFFDYQTDVQDASPATARRLTRGTLLSRMADMHA